MVSLRLFRCLSAFVLVSLGLFSFAPVAHADSYYSPLNVASFAFSCGATACSSDPNLSSSAAFYLRASGSPVTSQGAAVTANIGNYAIPADTGTYYTVVLGCSGLVNVGNRGNTQETWGGISHCVLDLTGGPFLDSTGQVYLVDYQPMVGSGFADDQAVDVVTDPANATSGFLATFLVLDPRHITSFGMTARVFLDPGSGGDYPFVVFGGVVDPGSGGGGGPDYTQLIDELESNTADLDENTDQIEGILDQLEDTTGQVRDEVDQLEEISQAALDWAQDELVTVESVVLPAPDPEPDAGLSDVINSVLGLADVTNLTTCSGGVDLGPMWGHGNTTPVVIPCRTDQIPPVIATAVGVVLSFAMFMPLVWSAYRTAIKLVKGEPDAAIASAMAPTSVVLESIGLPGIEMDEKKGDDN